MQRLFLHSYVRWMWLAIAYISVMLLLDIAGGDLWLASKLYQLQGQQWLLKDHWLTSGVLHKGARIVNYICVFAVILLLIHYRKQRLQYPQRFKATMALLVSLLMAFSVVAWLKTVTNIACPWDLSMFGGSQPYFDLFTTRPSNLPTGHCFPAGHASVGYAWIALYYFFQIVNPARRFHGLALGIVPGLILGITQQLRGAHFISHDVTTLLLCLLIAHCCFRLTFGKASSIRRISGAETALAIET